MKTFILLTLLASPLLAQARPDQRIPVRKQAAVAPGAAAPAPVIVHDTVVVYRTDTLGVFQSALAAPVADVGGPAAATCHGLVLPLPIPLPFSHTSSSNGDVIGTTTTPEPGSLTLFGTGLLGLTMYVRKKKK